MARTTPADFYDDSVNIATIGRRHGFLRRMRVHGEAKNGFWWEGEYVHPQGIVSIYRQSDHTRLDFATGGRLFSRSWDKYFGDRTIGQLARAFVADLTSGTHHDR